jgi:hypothetical protein
MAFSEPGLKKGEEHLMSEEFMTTLLPIILIGLIALVVGAVAGFLLAGLANPAAPATPSKGKSMAELVRLWRDRRTGKVTLEMDGKMFGSAVEMSSQQKAALIQATDELQLWLAGGERVERAVSATLPVAAAVEPLPEPAPLAPAAAGAAVAAATGLAKPDSPASTESVLAPEPEVKPPSMQLGDILASAIRPSKGKTAPSPAKSIAAQVDEIVQEKLPGSAYKDHLIMVTEQPKGGLLVRVDQEHYEGIGDVADPGIQAFLRACVAEWEKRAGGSQ